MEYQEELTRSSLSNWPEIDIAHTEANLHAGQIVKLRLASARIAVDGEQDILSPTLLRCSVLATLGLTNPEISAKLLTGEDGIKTNLSRISQKLDIIARSQIAPAMFINQIYKIENPGKKLGLTEPEKKIVELIASGYSGPEIDSKLGLSLSCTNPDTINTKRSLNRISKRTHLSGRELITLGSIASGELDISTLEDTKVNPVVHRQRLPGHNQLIRLL